MSHRQTLITHFARQCAGEQPVELSLLAGDASFRRYLRGTTANRSFVLVDAPPPESLEPFVSVALAYAEAGLRVPDILATDHDQGLMAQEDLGDRLFGAEVTSVNAAACYQQALAQLPAIAGVRHTRLGRLPSYDEALLQRENQLFTDWLLARHLGIELTRAEQQLWQQLNRQLIDNALSQPQVGVHRDYHSRNLMWVGQQPELAIIDFQDAVVGPVTYDVISLVRDCYVRWPAEQVTTWLEQARELLQSTGVLQPTVSAEQWRRWADWMGLQRHLKASGIFARLWHRDHKNRYLADIPNTIDYLVTVAAQYPELSAWSDFLTNKVQPALAQIMEEAASTS